MNEKAIDSSPNNLFVPFVRNMDWIEASSLAGQRCQSDILGRHTDVVTTCVGRKEAIQTVPNSLMSQVVAEPAEANFPVKKALASFSAETCDRTFTIGVSSDVEYALLPHLLRKLRVEAPNLRIQLTRTDAQRGWAMLEKGEICLSISLNSNESTSLNRQVLRVSPSTVLRADTVPGLLSVVDFCERPHVSVGFSTEMNAYIDRAVLQQGLSRKVALSISDFNVLPALLTGTDVLAVVPDYVASELVSKGGLRAETVPFARPNFNLAMSWSAASAADPAQRWLRLRCQMMLAA